MSQRNDIIELVLLNLQGRHQHVLSFRRLSPEDGLAPHTIVGMVEAQGASPQWATWRPNTHFIDFLCCYMQAKLQVKPALFEEDAHVAPGGFFYVIDGRTADPGGFVPSHDIVGAYRTDAEGRPVAESFQYNPNHRLVLEEGAFSSLLSDGRLYQAVLANTVSSFSGSPEKG
jgi:hypothetical protein